MFPGANGLPDPNSRATFRPAAPNPVDIQVGPDGALYYIDYEGGAIRRIASSTISNQPPIASATASPTNGGAADRQLRRQRLQRPREWVAHLRVDLDADGAFDDSTAVAPHTYNLGGNYAVRLQ